MDKLTKKRKLANGIDSKIFSDENRKKEAVRIML